ncbi:hypothetical protein [Streptomyces erythrochromogenes]|uniref:hypothetical protein n=1 Tax=Streptomyces erythrochromogenes TaxID=285574 RepID=UPI003866B00B|nr:hypothetical protein OG364_00095 [Streptomyces erythrochromogenes]WST98504.1 hypothetical protein OG364_41440 [Streptomyces erythrochromogenes]
MTAEEERDDRSILARIRSHTGWWLAAAAAVAGVVALLASVTWPYEWRAKANAVCDRRALRFWAAVEDSGDSLKALAEKGKLGGNVQDAEVRKAGVAYREAAAKLSDLIGDLREIDRPWVGKFPDKVETAVNDGSKLSRSMYFAGRQIMLRNPDEAKRHLGDVQKLTKDWETSSRALEAERCTEN